MAEAGSGLALGHCSHALHVSEGGGPGPVGLQRATLVQGQQRCLRVLNDLQNGAASQVTSWTVLRTRFTDQVAVFSTCHT